MSATPTDAEIRLVWNTDAPKGMCWQCTRCSHWASLGGNAGHHAVRTGHGLPQLKPLPDDVDTFDRDAPKPKKAMLAVRAGDYMQTGYDLKLALEVATVAINEAERAGSPAQTINKLREMVKTLRAS